MRLVDAALCLMRLEVLLLAELRPEQWLAGRGRTMRASGLLRPTVIPTAGAPCVLSDPHIRAEA